MSTVSTPLGTLKGTEYTTARGEVINCFQGVPYAKPPVGDLRFKDPVPVEPWEGVKLADKAPPTATIAWVDPQMNAGVAPGCSEDCLYLNVYTPQGTKSTDKLPVFAYIHGGGFTFGSGNKDYIGPDYLVPKGIILVTINYRLGVYGFLSFETTECSGNYGLKDQNLGLKWIQQNISAFGGDPGNVTLGGESAGAASVQYQMMSPLSKGLFHRAIAMSGSATCRWGYSRFAAKSAFILAKRLGYSGNDASEALKVLKSVPYDELALKTLGIFEEVEDIWAGENPLWSPFAPTAEPVGTPNAFLTKHPSQALKDEEYMDIPYMTGICESEGIYALKSADYVPKWEDDLEFQSMLPKELGISLGSDKVKAAAQKLRKFYFPNGSTQEGYIKILSMLLVSYGVFRTLDNYTKNSKKKTPNYMYQFAASRKPSLIKQMINVNDVEGCSHADDLEYVFLASHFPALAPARPILPGTDDELVMQNITNLYTEFCKTGVPPNWPAATPENGFAYMRINTKTELKKGCNADEVAFWNGIYEDLSS